jgi:hypothetical protein
VVWIMICIIGGALKYCGLVICTMLVVRLKEHEFL